MSVLSVTNTFVDATTITASPFNVNFADIVSYVNNRNDGTTAWDLIRATSSSDVVAIFDNSSGTNDIFRCRDNGTVVFAIEDGGEVKANVKSSIIMGTSSSYATVGGIASINVTPVGNVGSGEDTLMSYTLPAGAFSTNGKSVYILASGTFINNASTKHLKLYFGSATVVNTSTSNNVDWSIEARCFRSGSSSQFIIWSLTIGGSITVYNSVVTATQDDTAGILIKVTGEHGSGSTDNTVIQNVLLVEYKA